MLLRHDRALTAIAVALDIAFDAGRSGWAWRGLEPVMQALSRAGLLESLRGPRGGWRPSPWRIRCAAPRRRV